MPQDQRGGPSSQLVLNSQPERLEPISSVLIVTTAFQTCDLGALVPGEHQSGNFRDRRTMARGQQGGGLRREMSRWGRLTPLFLQ